MSSLTDTVINHFSYILSESMKDAGVSTETQASVKNAFRSKIQNEYKYIQRMLGSKSR